MKILIIEDEVHLAQALAAMLRETGAQVDTVFTGTDGLSYAQNAAYDVIVLDVMLPGFTGYEIVQTLRAQQNTTPVLMLTAKDEIQSKVYGLDCGADDYMTKPFDKQELLARVRALTRRPGELVQEVQTRGNTTLNLSTHMLSGKEKSIVLSHKEFEMMRVLFAAKDAITPKEVLIDKVWGMVSNAQDNNVEAYISFLRKKLVYVGANLEISTVRKAGYCLKEQVE